jgi:hypothetical protein
MELVPWIQDEAGLFDFARSYEAVEQYGLSALGRHEYQNLSESDQVRLLAMREMQLLSSAEFALLPFRLLPRSFLPPEKSPISVSGRDAELAFVTAHCDVFNMEHSNRNDADWSLADVVVFAGDAVKLEMVARDRGVDFRDLPLVYDRLREIVPHMGGFYEATPLGSEIWSCGLIRLQSVLWKAKFGLLLGTPNATGELAEYVQEVMWNVEIPAGAPT